MEKLYLPALKNTRALKSVYLKLLLGMMLCGGGNVMGQSYLGVDGGFEGSATVDNSSVFTIGQTNKWTKSNVSQTIGIETATVRSGTNSLRVNNTTTTGRRIFSPTFITTTGQRLVLQFYKRSSATTSQQEQRMISFNGAANGESISGTYFYVGAANTWEKITYAPTSTTSATTLWAGILNRLGSSSEDLFIDDVVIYVASAVDVTAPNAPASGATINNVTASSLDVNWTAASGGIDNGGYLVVRYTSNPGVNDDPNINGIYAVGNTIPGTVAGTVVYRGTGLSFTDGSLAAGIQYWYKVYTYDKAYNYSSEVTGNGTTSSSTCTAPTIQASALAFGSVTTNSMNVNWTNGNGAGRVVVMNTTNSFTVPTDGSLPAANTVYSGSGEQVVYAGTGSGPVTVTGLSTSTTYWYRVYEYCTSGTVFQTATDTDNPKSQATTAAAFTTTQNGDWYSTSTWTGGIVPGSTDNVIIDHDVFATASVTRDNGTTTTVNATHKLRMENDYVNNGTTTINGIFELGPNGYAAGNNFFSYAATGSTLIFNTGGGTYGITTGQKFWPTTNYPENVTVSTGMNIDINENVKTIPASGTMTLFGGMINTSGININGILLINQNGFVSVNSPVYGAASLLHYNTNTNPYNNSLEWTTTSSPANVQLSGNTVLNYPAGGLGARTISGNLTIDATSALYMDYGSPASMGLLTVNNIVVNGSLSLSNAFGGDLAVQGNWTLAGTFNPNNRAVYFNGGGLQSITGVTSFDYLTVNNNNSVILNNNVLVNQTLALTSGKINVGVNTLTIGSGGDITGYSSANFIVTNSTGALQRNGVGATAKWFPVGYGNPVTSYTPLTIVNNGTVSDLSVRATSPPQNPVTDNTRIVNVQWDVTSSGSGAVVDASFNWNTANQSVSYNVSGTGELGNYTTGPNYAITNIGTMGGQSKSVSGIALASGSNKLVLGNTNAVYVAPPANDLCANAITLVPNAAAVSGTTLAATASSPFPSDIDVWYKFTAPCTATYTISTSTVSQDLDIYIYGTACPVSSGGELGSGGTATNSSTESITLNATAGTTYYIEIVRFSGTAGSFNINLTGITSVPGQPSAITGNATVCSGTAQSYSVVNDAGATSYTWTLPATWGGTSSSNSINSTAGTTGGTISVTANNGCGSSTAQTLAVVVNPTPAAPAAVAGSNIGATTFTANWAAVPGAVGYFVDVYYTTPATDLFISEYVEGSSNNKYVEIYNGTGATINLSDYQLRLFANGAASVTTTLALTGTLAQGSTLVISDPSASIYAGTTITSGVANFNGDDALGLWKVSTASYVDIFGKIGNDPGSAWSLGGNTTVDKTLVRNSNVLGGVTVNPTGTGPGAFTTLGTEWTQSNIDVVTNLGSHTFSGGITYVPGYQDIYTTDTYLDVSGLNPNVTYYYVIRADNGNCISGNSNEVPVTTTACVATGTVVGTFTPTTGPVSTLVTINGHDFLNAPVSNGVKFGEVNATVYTILNDSTIIAEVPAGTATVSKIKVANSSGCFTSSAGNFTLIAVSGVCAMSDLIISEVLDPAAGSDHYIEIFNGTGSTINLNAPDNYTVEKFNGSNIQSFDITGTIAPGQVKIYYAGTNGGLASVPAQGIGSGFNEDDEIRLRKNGVIIDVMNTPDNSGFNWRRSNIVAGPNPVYTAAEWSLREENDANVNTSNIGLFTGGGTNLSFTTHPADQTCSLNMNVVATGSITNYQWKYYNPVSNAWENVTGGAFPGTTVTGASGATASTLTITGNIAPYYNYQFYCEINNGTSCYNASNAAQWEYSTKAFYRANSGAGDWTTAGSWLISDNIAGPWVAACTYPLASNSSAVIIPSGMKIIHATNQAIDIDKVTIDAGGELEVGILAGLNIFNGGSNADLIVNGTLFDRTGSGTGNGIKLDHTGTVNDATWILGANATIIKTSSSSAGDYRDFYEAGIINMEPTAHWIYRYDNIATTSIGFASANASNPMYYPNLTLENSVSGNHYRSSFNNTTPALSVFAMVSAGNPVVIKGNFDIGGSGPGTIGFLNINTHSPVSVLGNLIIRTGDTLRNDGNATNNGTGLDVKGNLTVNGMLINNGAAAATGVLRFSGSNTQAVTGTGTIDLENVDIANSGAGGTGVDIQRDIDIPGILSFAGAAPKINLSAGFVTMKSTATRTAQISAVPAAAGISYGATGRFNIERYLPSYRAWRFVAAPVVKGAGESPSVREAWQEAGAATAGYGTYITGPSLAGTGFDALSAGYSLKWFDASINNYREIGNTNDSLVANDAGYMVYVRGDRTVSPTGTTTPTNLRIRGKIRTGDQTFTIPGGTSGAFQSIGNPYASAFSVAGLINNYTPAELAQSYVAWDPTLSGSYGVGGFQTLTEVDGYQATASGSDLYLAGSQYPNIESGQAFYLFNPSTAPVNVVITEDMKQGGSRLASRENTPADRQFLRTKLYTAGGAIADGSLVAIDDEYDNGPDAWDALKFTNGGENFGVARYGKKLSVEARGRLQANDTIFYSMSNLREQAYQVQISPENLASTGMEAYFIDRFLNTQTPVSLAGTTTLNITVTSNAASKAANRFLLVFKALAGPLPVTFVSVSAQRQSDRSIGVNWKVANELNIVKYEVERSADGTQFNAILTRDAAGISNYSKTDLSPLASDNFYRIKAIGIGGEITYSAIVKVAPDKEPALIAVTPNPVKDKQLNIRFVKQLPGDYHVQLSNAIGQVVYKGVVTIESGNMIKNIGLPAETVTGNYQLSVRNKQGQIVHSQSLLVE
jgi:hypothetical protein